MLWNINKCIFRRKDYVNQHRFKLKIKGTKNLGSSMYLPSHNTGLPIGPKQILRGDFSHLSRESFNAATASLTRSPPYWQSPAQSVVQPPFLTCSVQPPFVSVRSCCDLCSFGKLTLQYRINEFTGGALLRFVLSSSKMPHKEKTS